jgi:glucosamine-6-phosphate deaminase
MLVILKNNSEELDREAARIIASAIRRNPSLRLGLATGSTTIGVYSELARMHRDEGLDFSRVVTFNLDEYVGLSGNHPQSFRYFMQQNLFRHVNVDPVNIHIPDGTLRGNYDEYCAAYERSIRDAGGIDLQILGIGRNGHIGFNEPASSLGSRTRLKALTRETLEDNRKFFLSDGDMPKCAVTVGIGTILEARRIVLLADGSSKATAVARAIEGPITASVTASALQLHPDVTFIVSEDAATGLAQKDYYRHILELTAEFTPSRLW